MSTETGNALPPRSEAFRRFTAAPLIFALLMMLATGALAALVVRGGQAAGPRAVLAFTGECAAVAAPVLAARAAAIGLGDPVQSVGAGRLELTATLPGLPDDLTHIPALLARPGRLRIGPAEAPLATEADIAGAEVRLDEGGLPYAWVTLKPEAAGRVDAAFAAAHGDSTPITIDGVVVADRPNNALEQSGLRIITQVAMPSRERMRVAADQAIILSHGPVPCVLSVGEARVLATAPPAG
jgi:hypothetical protein